MLGYIIMRDSDEYKSIMAVILQRPATHFSISFTVEGIYKYITINNITYFNGVKYDTEENIDNCPVITRFLCKLKKKK